MRAAAAFIVAQPDNDLIRLTVIKNDVTPGQGSNLIGIQATEQMQSHGARLCSLSNTIYELVVDLLDIGLIEDLRCFRCRCFFIRRSRPPRQWRERIGSGAVFVFYAPIPKVAKKFVISLR